MPLDLVNILQVGFSGLVFLLAFLAYNIINSEQKTEQPRAEILRESKSFRSFAFAVAVLALAAPFVEVLMNNEEPNVQTGASCAYRETTLTRGIPVPAAGLSGVSLTLVDTQVGRNGNVRRGGNVTIMATDSDRTQYFEEGPGNLVLNDKSYITVVSDVLEDSVRFTLCGPLF